jgi:hypothetical protein
MDNDYYHSGVEKDVLERRNKGIDHRWKELYELETAAEKETLKFLFVTNSGGAIATLSFMGASELARTNCLAKISLILFVLGVILVGITRGIILLRLSSVFKAYRTDVSHYFAQKKGYRSVSHEDEERCKSVFLPYLVGCMSAAALILGCILGGSALFR